MNRDRPENPRLSGGRLSDRGRAREDEKRRRLAEALRDNLRKRKVQSRDRAANGPTDPECGEVDGDEA